MRDYFRLAFPEEIHKKLQRANLAESAHERMRAIHSNIYPAGGNEVIVQYFSGSAPLITRGLMEKLDGPSIDGKERKEIPVTFQVRMNRDIQPIFEKNSEAGFGYLITPFEFSNNPDTEQICRIIGLEKDGLVIRYEHVDMIEKWYSEFEKLDAQTRRAYNDHILNPSKVPSDNFLPWYRRQL
jgi:hypothetical protein